MSSEKIGEISYQLIKWYGPDCSYGTSKSMAEGCMYEAFYMVQSYLEIQMESSTPSERKVLKTVHTYVSGMIQDTK